MEAQRTAIEPGAWFHTFRLKRLIGRGGIGEVWEIKNKGSAEALKIIQTKWLGEEILKRRMVDEGELLVRIKHPNVVEVHETGTTPEGHVWIRMELLRGDTLREVMNRRGLISVALACTYMRAAGHAAHQCHVIGAVHRDIKPENLFVTNPDETVKLLDFGIAKLYGSPDTAEGQRHGTPLYMAPEQIRGHKVTPATDVYALGLVAYEVLCGANPFVDDPRAYDLYALYYKHFTEVPAPLTSIGIPAEISDIVAKALAKDPRERYQNGLEFADALWGAWSIVRERDPGWDTEPGEPTREELMERADDGLSFGTGPAEGRRPSAPADVRPSHVSRPSRISLVHRAVVRAKTEPLPQVPRDTESLIPFLAERASSLPPAPSPQPEAQQTQTRREPPAPPASTRRLAPVVELASRAKWVPVQTTVPLPPVPADLDSLRQDVPPAPARRPEFEALRVPHRAVSAPTVPYPPPPRDEAEGSVTHAPTALPPEPQSATAREAHAWAEAPDLNKAGIRPVQGVEVHVNPRQAGTFALPDPQALAAARTAAKLATRPGQHRIERGFIVLAATSVILVTVFLVLHVVRTGHRSEPNAQSNVAPSIAAPVATTTATAPALPPASASTAAPLASNDRRVEPTRAASGQTAPSAPALPRPPSTTTKPARPRRDVVDPWAR